MEAALMRRAKVRPRENVQIETLLHVRAPASQERRRRRGAGWLFHSCESQSDKRVILQAASNAETIRDDRDAEIAELVGRTNTAAEQNRRNPIRSSGQDDLVAVDGLPGLRKLNPDSAVSSTDYSVDHDAVSEGEVRSGSSAMEIRSRCAATNSTQTG